MLGDVGLGRGDALRERRTGTQTSVPSAAPAGRSALVASIAPWRARHSRRRSDSSVGPGEVAAAELGRDRGGFTGDAATASLGGALELQEQRRRDRERHLVVSRLIASITISSTSSTRTTGIANWPEVERALRRRGHRRERA